MPVPFDLLRCLLLLCLVLHRARAACLGNDMERRRRLLVDDLWGVRDRERDERYDLLEKLDRFEPYDLLDLNDGDRERVGDLEL